MSKPAKHPGSFWEWSRNVKPATDGVRVEEVAAALGLAVYSLNKMRKGIWAVPFRIRMRMDVAFEEGEGESPHNGPYERDNIKEVDIVALPTADVLMERRRKALEAVERARRTSPSAVRQKEKLANQFQEPEEDEPVPAYTPPPGGARQGADPSKLLGDLLIGQGVSIEQRDDVLKSLVRMAKIGEEIIDKLEVLIGRIDLALELRTRPKPPDELQATVNGVVSPKTIHQHEAEVTEQQSPYIDR